jgi:hypothetical protein
MITPDTRAAFNEHAIDYGPNATSAIWTAASARRINFTVLNYFRGSW